MVSFLRKGLEYKVEKLKYKKLGGYSAKDQNQIRTSSWQIDHPRSVHTKSTSSPRLFPQTVGGPPHPFVEGKALGTSLTPSFTVLIH